MTPEDRDALIEAGYNPDDPDVQDRMMKVEHGLNCCVGAGTHSRATSADTAARDKHRGDIATTDTLAIAANSLVARGDAIHWANGGRGHPQFIASPPTSGMTVWTLVSVATTCPPRPRPAPVYR